MKRKEHWLTRFGMRLAKDDLDKTIKQKPLPKDIIGLQAPISIDEAPGGYILLKGKKKVKASSYGYCVANFNVYGQRELI